MRSPSAKRRALIEQTQGMLMFVYGIDADGAFQLLRWQSQQHNVKLRLIAEQISKDLVELSRADGQARRHAMDGVDAAGGGGAAGKPASPERESFGKLWRYDL